MFLDGGANVGDTVDVFAIGPGRHMQAYFEAGRAYYERMLLPDTNGSAMKLCDHRMNCESNFDRALHQAGITARPTPWLFVTQYRD